MKPLEVGETGMLQNFHDYSCCKNGSIALVQCIAPHILLAEGYYYGIKEFGNPSLHRTGYWAIDKHQIRRISNPDASQSTEQEKVVVV